LFEGWVAAQDVLGVLEEGAVFKVGVPKSRAFEVEVAQILQVAEHLVGDGF
jgi:hypothetical protein